MNFSFDQIAHHQRILITGKRAPEILNLCQRVLNYHKKPFNVLNGEDEITDEPIVLIQANENFLQYEPHIVLIDEAPDEKKSEYNQLADSIPKSGTIVYNMSDAVTKEIGSKERTDVHQVPYNGELESAVRGVLQRIGIAGDRFNQAL